MGTKSHLLLLIYLGVCTAWMDERPVLESQDGNLIISSAMDRNITLKIVGNGYINVNDINLLHVANAAHNATRLIERWKTGYLMEVESTLQRLSNDVEGPMGLQKRMLAFENLLAGTQRNQTLPAGVPSRAGLRRVNERIRRLEDNVRTILSTLRENECLSGPCQNGGTCQDLYASYQCHCPSNWEGPNCLTDVNECAKFLGTDLGCQNGATCFNSQGSYRCECPPGWFGLHCTQKTSICNTENTEELCGHGVCVSKSSSPLGYTCICDQGWQSDGTNPACTKDVDECAGKHPSCSVNPPVACRNVPGSFFCESCPHGYSGNGYYCSDIDECLVDNGGCSTQPRVQCINTMGSRVCGACPVGYRGDGVTCIYVGGCAINNGGCHPLASCVENPALTSAYVQCRCPRGYQGNGIGPNGCQPVTDGFDNSVCTSSPCHYGSCVPGAGHTFTCICNRGYTGLLCNIPVDPCSPNPCKNNGACVVLNGVASCDCPPTFTGNRCETPRQTCGGVNRNPVGRLEFPIGGNTYQHGLSCAWVLITNHSLVLNVTFTSFNLEQSAECKFDFLQIHDGRNAGTHQIGRFCGNQLPNGNGNIVSSHKSLYFWFHSDSSISHEGFALHWNSIEPVCGGYLTDDYGTITSPGSPGRYPPNRNCSWRINVRFSKRIQFHFGLLMLEEHPTCANDYVDITGVDGEVLALYCNHSRPAPLTTPGSEAVVHFHSNGATQDAGFHIHYSTIEGVPGCSGIFTEFTGVISTPTHESTYHPDLECEWKIQMPPSDRIKITWTKFDLESSMSCMFDVVEIFDGENTEAPLLGRYCGNDLPPQLKSTGNNLVVVFKSDSSFEMEGFSFSYEVLCGGEFVEETGIIQSPMYPNPYHGSRTCYYEIIQPLGKGISLSILDLDIEGHSPPDCYFDYLEIFDGDTDNATKLDTLCGETSNIPSEPYFSSQNYMLMKFTTDSSLEGRGFKANFTTIERKCGGLMKTPEGMIHSPSENGVYGNEEYCIWTILAPPGYVIQLTWLSFSLEWQARCLNDYVSVYENYTSSESELLNRFCGTKIPPILLTQSNTMTIIFRTDDSINANGFTASYAFIDATKVCGAHYTKSTGVLRSPDYPKQYPNGKECEWVIEVPNKFKITLDVKHFDLEKHSNCMFDFLEIRNGGYNNSPLIGRYCNPDIPTQIISQTNLLYLKFRSDESRPGEGFEISWSSRTQGCGGTLNAASGDIVSPNYPQSYAENIDCMWKIVVAAGNLVQLVIVDLDLESHYKCRFDYLEISEGIERRANLQRYCGAQYPKVILTKSNTVTVRFRSDFFTSGRGFHLKYETICHNTLRGFYGVIESPNFPDKYEHNTNCSWIINAPKGNKINMTFSHFDLERSVEGDPCVFDYIEVKEGMDGQPNTQIGKFCEAKPPPTRIHTGQNQLFMSFITDSFIAFNGFRAEWAIDGCGGHLTRPFGTFASPGYPSGYRASIECEWLIEADYTHSIELTLHEVKTEKQINCLFDKLQVFGGEDDQAPKLLEICYVEKDTLYTVPGNKLFVRFISDGSYINRGFNASYKSVPIRCGGKFSADSGIIQSANYPQNYPHKETCEWLLQVDNNHVVNITFMDFDIENTINCTEDYLRIFDGPTKDSLVLANLCGSDLPPSYVSTSNEMLVVMKSDNIISAKGFKAIYHRACGARIIVKDEGVITPPNFYTSTKKRDSANCTWILVAEDPADHVTLTFMHLDMDPSHLKAFPACNWNYLQVLEGEGLDGPQVGKWCDNFAPAPVTSVGDALTMHLYSRYDFHGHFAIMYSTLNSACGGNYTSERGTITSPGYPNSYPLNSECVWILNNAPGNRIQISFPMFDIEQSDNCDLDYLEIRLQSSIGSLLGVTCGTINDVYTVSDTLWLKFKSDGAGTGKGFRAEYHFVGGNELEGPSGRITSPLFPHPYNKAGVFTWRITVDSGWLVRIEVKDLYIEVMGTNCAQSLTVYDGYNDQASSLFEVCGFDKPEPVTTSSNIAYIVMDVDFMRTGSWFDLTWIQIPKEPASNNAEIKLSECNKEVALIDKANNTYTFHSPGWPHGYGINLNCNWLFTSPPGTHLALRISSMNIEETSNCVADALSVYSGNALTSTDDATLIQRLCYSNATDSIIKAGNLMTVKFESDSYMNKTGFNAHVSRECGGKLGGPNGIIEINNTSARDVRMWHFTCEWVVEVRAGRTIEVFFDSMDIALRPNNPSWGENYLMLKNGGDITSPLLGDGKYHGNVIPAPVETVGNKLYVKATGTFPSVNFKLSYREKNMNCGGDFVLSNKVQEWEINSPNYPNIPHPYAECIWKAMAPAGERISIHFVERFDLTDTSDCSLEYVEVRDGATENSKVLGRFCGRTAPSSIITTGNVIYVHFYTDAAEPKNGFKAVINSGEVCGGIIRNNSGTIRSPNYPFFYPKNVTCGWWIVGPPEHTLKIEFADLHLPGFRRCDITDHVTIEEKILEGGNDTLSNIGTFCGSSKPAPLETSSNEAYISFHSDNREYSTNRGFSLNFVASQEICGGELTALTGIIKSVGYPAPRVRSRYCDWRIKLPEGFQVVIDILDIDIGGSTTGTQIGYSLSFYNDFKFKSRITVLGRRAAPAKDPSEQIKSTSNTMMIGYFASAGHRGFKLRYSANAPAPCGASINDIKGSLIGPESPYNGSSYYCQWILRAPENLVNNLNDTGLTMSIKATGYLGGSEAHRNSRFCYFPQYLSVEGVGMLCGNITEPKYLRSPKAENKIIIVQGTYIINPMNFNIQYEWQPCGGTLSGPRHTIHSPKNIPYPINCAWKVEYPNNGETIKLDFGRLNLGSCDTAYISIRNGGPSSPEIGKFCGNIKPYNITSTSNHLWIEYFATGEPNDFELSLETVGAGCGGALRGNSREISSPEFPRQYPNNAECTWEITAEDGYHVGLSFVDRFSLETSNDCTKDYVQVDDWVKDQKTGGHWEELIKMCGRITPQPINSTGNRMKVTFHSNEAVQNDGFRAIWNENCGGRFVVTDEMKTIQSPAYPSIYRPNMFCNYSLVAETPGQNILVEFTEFQIERRRGECIYDNVTIVKHDASGYTEEGTWCGEDMPPLQRSTEHMEIIFKTDKYVQRNGFQFKYYTNNCGGVITSPDEIKPLVRNGEYFGRMNCTWIIRAPEGKNVVLRFEKFITEYTAQCYYDRVRVYNGEWIVSDQLLGVTCGNLTDHLPIFKSDSNTMVVNFESDDSRHYEGFNAKVLFTNGPAVGCGGKVNLTAIPSQSFRTQKGAMYDSLEDCHWTITASEGKNVKFTIHSMDLKNGTNNTGIIDGNEECTGDYLEIRDGQGPYAEPLGKFCGIQIPPAIQSTTESLWIRFFSDGTENGAGVTGTFETVDSQCGTLVRVVNDTTQVLTLPSYPNSYAPGTRCRWILRHPDVFIDRILIRFLEFSMPDSKMCDKDYLQITDKHNRKYINEGFGENLIVSGTLRHDLLMHMGTRSPIASYKYCGSVLPHQYYSYSSEVEIAFRGDSGGQKGFKLEFSTPVCNRNYTAEQGRIIHQGFTDCWITITAPVNHTISLYFNDFRLYDYKHCTQTALQVREGTYTGNLLATECGVETPSPIFSTGNKLSLHSWSETKAAYQSYDIIYTTTDQGRGCGGNIFNYGGTFTSPLYPNIYRRDAMCAWHISVPRGFTVVLKFTMFDIGTKKSCENNNVKIFDIASTGESLLQTTFCGGDEPAMFESTSDRIVVVYTTNVNNVGTGWIAQFMGKPVGHFTKVLEGW